MVSAIQVCVFDLDGVLRHWEPSRVREAESGAALPAGALADVLDKVPEFHQGVLGQVSFPAWCDAVEQAVSHVHGAVAAASAVAVWRSYRGTLDADMVALLRAVRNLVPVALLSNAHDCLYDDLRVHGLDDAFDWVMSSADLGLAKPDPAIYLAAAALMNVPPSACFFVDDLAANVEGAREVGMQAVVFEGRSALVRDLTEMGLDVVAATY